MQVGYMRNIRKPRPQGFAQLLAKTTKYYGIDLVYFHPEDINIEKKSVQGKLLENNKWVTKEVPVPTFVDVSLYSFKYKEQIQFLRKHSNFTTGKLGAKDTTIRKIREDGEFAHLLIPTVHNSSFDEFHNFLNKHREIVMKPRSGQKGEGIYKLTKDKEDYCLSYEAKEETLSPKQLKEFYNNILSKRKYIFQKYIVSRTKDGNPFDCRIRLEKNGQGKWQIVTYLVRVGTGQKVVSNISQGGSVSDLDPFLKNHYGDKWKVIKDNIVKFGEKFPYKIESLYNRKLQSLGIDIGIDKRGKLYFFESNNAPGSRFGWGEVASVKSDYYNYMLNKVSIKDT